MKTGLIIYIYPSDDFLIFIFTYLTLSIYQRWLYPVDTTRVNEFGTSEELLAKMEQEKNGGAAVTNGDAPAVAADETASSSMTGDKKND